MLNVQICLTFYPLPVWQKLETENQEFFRAYHLRLIVKDQILRFNELLERQVELMRQVCQTGVASMSLSNGSQMHLSKSLLEVTMNFSSHYCIPPISSS